MDHTLEQEQRRFHYSLWIAGGLHLLLFAVLGAMAVQQRPDFPFKIVDIRIADGLQRNTPTSVSSPPQKTPATVAGANDAASPPPKPVARPSQAPPRVVRKAPPEDKVPLWQKEEVWQRTRGKGEKNRPVARSLEDYIEKGEVLSRIGSLGPESDEAVRQRYTQVLSLWLYKFREYPEEAKRAGLRGQAILRIRIDRKGRILYFQIDRSTGHALLDQAIRDTVVRANPVPEVPPHFPGGSQLEFVMAMRFVPD